MEVGLRESCLAEKLFEQMHGAEAEEVAGVEGGADFPFVVGGCGGSGGDENSNCYTDQNCLPTKA